MATLLTFDPSRCRRPAPSHAKPEASAATAQVLMFTGVRREALDQPRHPEPMFIDPAPEKPNGKKRSRRKNA